MSRSERAVETIAEAAAVRARVELLVVPLWWGAPQRHGSSRPPRGADGAFRRADTCGSIELVVGLELRARSWRSVACVGMAIMLATCDASQIADGGVTHDAPADDRVPSPDPPRWSPCPEGWRVIEEGPATACDPWPIGGYRGDCAFDEAHFPGTPGCALVGTTCPADGWPAVLPVDRPIVYVEAGAAPGGTGSSRDRALGSIAEAVAVAPEGAVIAIAAGVYAETVVVRAGQTLWGTCPAGTRLSPRTPGGPSVVLTLAEPGAAARNLSIDAPDRRGIGVAAPDVELDSIVVSQAQINGLIVTGGGVARARRLVVRDMRGDTELDPAIRVALASSLVLEQALVERSADEGVFVQDDGSVLEATDLAVRETATLPDGTRGRGLRVDAGGRVRLRRCVLELNHDGALLASGAGAVVDASEVVLRDTATRGDGRSASGASALDGATVSLDRALVERNAGAGLLAHASVLRATDVVVRDTHPRSDGSFGRAVEAANGAMVELLRAVLARSREVALLAARGGAILEARHVAVRDTVGRDDGLLGFGAWAELDARLVLERAWIDGSRTAGLGAYDAEVVATELHVDRTTAAACAETTCADVSGGFGLVAHGGATIDVAGFHVRDSAVCGVVVGDGATSIDLASGVIELAPVGACLQQSGYDTSRLRRDVQYREVGVPLQAAEYELPRLMP